MKASAQGAAATLALGYDSSVRPDIPSSSMCQPWARRPSGPGGMLRRTGRSSRNTRKPPTPRVPSAAMSHAETGETSEIPVISDHPDTGSVPEGDVPTPPPARRARWWRLLALISVLVLVLVVVLQAL